MDFEFNADHRPATREELATIEKIQKRDNRSVNFRWFVAGATILGLGICYVRNKYGKAPLIEIHQDEKKKTATKQKKEEKKEGEKK